MSEINQQNIIIVVGDLGSGVNMVKNVLLLSPEVDFPIAPNSRLEYIKNLVYPDQLKDNLKNWIKFEYKLRNWKSLYQIDIADFYADIDTPKVIEISQHSRIVFITHWPDIALQLKNKYSNIKLIALYPKTDKDLQWQINTYIEKLGIERLQNFSFNDNIDQQKNNYISQYGIEEYYKFNVLNMFEIMQERADSYKNLPAYQIAISDLQNAEWIDGLSEYLNINLNLDQAHSLINTWKDFHQMIDGNNIKRSKHVLESN